VTVSLYFTYLSMRTAIIASLALYLASAINIFLFDGWKSVFPGWLSILAGFCFVGAFSLANRLLHREQQRSQSLLRQLEASNRELEAAHQQLQIYANEVEELAVARERTRMAREIHDTLGHYLAIIRIQLETISKLQEHDYTRARAEVEEAKRVAAQCIQEVRNAVAALRPTSIATLNSIEALTQLGAEFRATSPEIELTLDLETTLPPLSAELQLACYRAAQEALTNVRKHAHATKVLLRLRYEDETLELMVRDNGKGIPGSRASQQTAGFGLIGLRERIELLGGQVRYGPLEPSGYRVTVLIRLPHADPDPAHLVEQGEAI
jgi:signal transduction histidine kinase